MRDETVMVELSSDLSLNHDAMVNHIVFFFLNLTSDCSLLVC